MCSHLERNTPISRSLAVDGSAHQVKRAQTLPLLNAIVCYRVMGLFFMTGHKNGDDGVMPCCGLVLCSALRVDHPGKPSTMGIFTLCVWHNIT